MREYAGRGVRGVFHAFSDGVESYRELKTCGDFLFGIGGVVTFKKSRIAEVVREMELQDLLLETDCPYLTPAPHRGQRNESAYVRYVCEKVAELKGISAEEVARITTANAERMFGVTVGRDPGTERALQGEESGPKSPTQDGVSSSEGPTDKTGKTNEPHR